MRRKKKKGIYIFLTVCAVALGPYALSAAERDTASTPYVAPESTPQISPPSQLRVSTISSRRIDLHWRYTVSEEITHSGFIIYRRKEGSKKWKKIVIDDPQKRSYSDTSLAPCTKYYYRIRTYKGSTISKPLRPVNGITFPEYPVLIV